MITLVVVGRTRPPLDRAVAEFEERAARYWKLEFVEVPAGAGHGRHATADEVMRAEADRIGSRLPDRCELWLVTREGRTVNSTQLADLLADRQLHGGPPMALCIGGAYGFADALRQRADQTLSLSAMTLPHEMARLVLAEQLYRAGTILRGEPYHKGSD